MKFIDNANVDASADEKTPTKPQERSPKMPDTLELQESAESGLSSHALFGMGDELEFKRQFAVQFLASWAATHYTEYCARGMQETLGTPPVEDAEYLAQKAWEQWCAILLPNA